jgi:hypothetical protein
MDQLSNLVRRVRGNSSYARRDKDAERPPRPRHHHQRQVEYEPEVDDDKPLDLEPLQVEMHEAQPEPDPKVFLGGPSDKFVFTKYEGHIVRCITTML